MSERCAVAARRRDDAMVGTAPPQRRFLLVEDDGPWGSDAHPVGSLAVPTVEHLRSWCSRSGARLLLVKRHGRSRRTTSRRTWFLADTATGELRTGHAHDDDLAAWRPTDGHVDPRPIVLVCTQGRHDVCCAVDGRPVAHALARDAPDRTWECSHLGGDRFAGNVLCLPSGASYGRVAPDDVARILEAERVGEVQLHIMRGRAGRAPWLQAAEHAVRAELGLLGLHAVRAVRATPVAEHHWVARVESREGVHQVQVRGVREPVTEPLTCRGSAPAAYIRWDAHLLTTGG